VTSAHLRAIALDPGLRGRPTQLYLLLLDELDHDEERPLKQLVLARRLRMRRAHVSRALRLLVHRGLVARRIRPDGLDGRLYHYRLLVPANEPAVVPNSPA
jgi:predicted transcriptional regulator